jgi:hypothetical protein
MAYLLEKHKNTRISQFTKPTTSTNNLNSNSNTLNFNMDTLFREFSELMDDANDKMPEGTYLALYNKLKELKERDGDAQGPTDEKAHLKGEVMLLRREIVRLGIKMFSFGDWGDESSDDEDEDEPDDELYGCPIPLAGGREALDRAYSTYNASPSIIEESAVSERENNQPLGYQTMWSEEDMEATIGMHEREVKELKDQIKELEESALRSRPRCRCGSTTHRNPNFLGCRLNKRVLAGVLGTTARDRALAETAALADPPNVV